MKMITAIIRHQRLDDLRRALMDLGVEGMTTVDVKGFGRQKGHKETYRGMEVEVNFLPKLKVEVAVDASMEEAVVQAIRGAARSGDEGRIGDGKIFIYNLQDTVRIRTGETGREAL